MKIAFFTHVSDDWYLPCGCQKLERSAKYFHPEIPFFTFRGVLDPKIDWNWNLDYVHPFMTLKMTCAAKLASDYDLVVYFDADQIIVDRLDELIAGDYEVAGVRNNHDFGGVMNYPADMYPNIDDVYKVLNAGLVASTNKQFWPDWLELASRRKFKRGEQGALNELAYNGKYKTKILDPVESNVYYGLSGVVGRSSPWESWLEIQVKDGLYLWGKKFKILHQAGGQSPERFQASLFTKETVAYLEKVTSTKFI